MRRLGGERRGSAAVEFALVAPVFLMFLFFLLEGGRMVFTRQGLNELAYAAARCSALQATGCTNEAGVKIWTVAQGRQRSNIFLTVDQVAVVPSATCNGQTPMAQVTLELPYNSTALSLLPRNAAVSPLRARGCFPVPS